MTAVTHQLRFDWLDVARDRQARFFALAMPVGFLFLFCTIFGNATLLIGGHLIRESTYYVAAMTTYGIVDVAFITLAVSTVEARESGLLRRRQATPQPAWAILASRTIVGLSGGAAIAVLLLGIGRAVYGASVPLAALLPLMLAVVVGCASFVCLGFAASTLSRSTQSAQPVALALSMPLFFLSGVFVPWTDLPSWLRRVADVFPVRNEALALLNPFTHSAGGPAWSASNLLVVAAWGVAGLVLTLRRFRWATRDV
jgi:ABC-2 type transport system permease protein